MNAPRDRANDPPLLLKPASVAALLQIGLRTLWRWIEDDKFPPPDLRMGPKVVRWRRATVDAWVAANAVPVEVAASAKGGQTHVG
jgi:predicted DNA-binding transcriptional regulator AlpA